MGDSLREVCGEMGGKVDIKHKTVTNAPGLDKVKDLTLIIIQPTLASWLRID